MEFTWDETKRAKVIAEYNVDFAKIQDTFDDPFAVYFEDFEHSTDDETHFDVIGQSLNYGLIFAVFHTKMTIIFVLSQLEKLKIGW